MKHKHVTKRAFKVKCRECGKPILYWECAICNAKTFFSLPVYGKPIRHICEKYLTKKGKNLPLWRTEKEVKPQNLLDLLKTKSFFCPVCDKLFDSEKSMDNHINELRKIDDEHEIFFNKVLDFIDFSENDTKSEILGSSDENKNDQTRNYNEVGPHGFRIKRRKKKE